MRIDRIVAYGCSFTQGQELGDAEILQIDEATLDKKKREVGVLDYLSIYKTHEIKTKCDDYSSTLSWPTHLAKKLNIPYWNRAFFGTSLGDAIFRLTHDLENGLIQDNDLIIIGITCPSRFSVLTDETPPRMITRMLGYGHPFWPSKEIHEFMVKTWGTDNNIIWEHIKNLKYLDYLSDSLGGRIKMVTTVYSLNHLLEHSYPNHISWLSNIQFKHLLDRDISFSKTYSDGYDAEAFENAVHGWMHPKLEYHIKFADLVYDMLKDRNIIQ